MPTMTTKKKPTTKKPERAEETPTTLDGGQALLPGVEAEAVTPVPSPRAWTWPGKARCPRCNSTETLRVSDDGPTQYRRCKRAICRHPFKVQGVAV
jgi:hypothetical protein